MALLLHKILQGEINVILDGIMVAHGCVRSESLPEYVANILP